MNISDFINTYGHIYFRAIKNKCSTEEDEKKITYLKSLGIKHLCGLNHLETLPRDFENYRSLITNIDVNKIHLNESCQKGDNVIIKSVYLYGKISHYQNNFAIYIQMAKMMSKGDEVDGDIRNLNKKNLEEIDSIVVNIKKSLSEFERMSLTILLSSRDKNNIFGGRMSKYIIYSIINEIFNIFYLKKLYIAYNSIITDVYTKRIADLKKWEKIKIERETKRLEEKHETMLNGLAYYREKQEERIHDRKGFNGERIYKQNLNYICGEDIVEEKVLENIEDLENKNNVSLCDFITSTTKKKSQRRRRKKNNK